MTIDPYRGLCIRCERPMVEHAYGGACPEVTAETVTDEQIQMLRDSVVGDAAVTLLCRVALQHGAAIDLHPWCHACGWRKGGRDSWDGVACKCKLRAGPFCRCTRCAGLGTVPYDVGSQHCTSCDGSGLVDPIEIARARSKAAAAINARNAAVE